MMAIRINITWQTALFASVLAAVGAALTFGTVQAAYSAGQLAAEIPNAKSTFVQHEKTCESDLAAARAAYGTARGAVNASQPYKYNNWISLRNQPAQRTTSLLPAGNISLNLQFNQSLFVCAILTNPASGTDRTRSASRVSNSQYPNNRSIVRGGSSPNRTELYQKSALIKNARIISGPGTLTSVNGSQRAIKVDSDGRYSFANSIPFTYKANLSGTVNVKIRLTFIEVRTYFNKPGSSGSGTSCDSRTRSGKYVQHWVEYNKPVTASTFADPACNRVLTLDDTIQVRVIPPIKWTTSGTTTVNQAQASPGDTLKWTHRLSNNGPDRTNKSIRSYVGRTGFTSNTNISSTLTSSGRARGTIRGPFTTTYVVKASDVGKTLCQRLHWRPSSSTSSATRSATNRCVTVPYLFNLTPSLSGPTGALSAGANIADVEPRVTNQSTATPSKTTKTPNTIKWRLGRVDVAPGGSIPMGQAQNNNTPQSQYGSDWVQKGSGTRSFPAGTTVLSLLENEKVGTSTPIGTRICFTLSVQPYSSASSLWRHGVPICLDVNKRPSVQVWGGDLRATGIINTATIQGKKGSGTATFGSWVEYGAFSTGVNANFGSGAGLTKGYSGAGSKADWNELTFANTPAYGSFNFGTPADLSTQFTAATGAPLAGGGVRNVASLGSGTYRVSSNLRITGTVPQGRSIVINAAGHRVTIEGNLNYGGQPYNSRDDIPQLIIVAGDIAIRDSVTSVNAWLLASGTIDTCGNVGTFGVMPATGKTLKEDVCDKQLQVNGPLTATKLVLKRTAGGDAGSPGDPAEIFNLRSDAYLWLQDRVADKGQVRTISTKELPPRF